LNPLATITEELWDKTKKLSQMIVIYGTTVVPDYEKTRLVDDFKVVFVFRYDGKIRELISST
jgi:hypothetical protein